MTIRLALAGALLCATATLAAAPQGDGEVVSITDTINASGTITVVQPAALTAMLRHTVATEPQEAGADSQGTTAHNATASATRTGYRVQIFEDNDPRSARNQAEHYNSELRTYFPHIRSYVTFNSPYWRVKAGDYRTRSEAEAALAEFREAFPRLGSYMRVVRDKINIYD